MIKKIIIVLTAAAVIVLAVNFYLNYRKNAIFRNPSFAYGNGRLEATEINISSKLPGRIEKIYVNDGDFVTKGELLALMQTDVLEAELSQAAARKNQSQASLAAALAAVELRKSEAEAAQADVRRKRSSFDGARKRYDRAAVLLKDAAVSRQDFEVDETYFQTCTADLAAAEASARKADAAVAAASADVEGARAAIIAAEADIARIKADLDDCRLTAPLAGRIQYRIAQPGEVLSAGGRVLNMVDLADVYMTFFLPESSAGKVRINSPVRLVMDADPNMPIPASVFFVSSVAQFTPKTVETAEERQKLMFRVKARIAPKLLEKHRDLVKSGLPGVAWVKLNDDEPWPKFLELRSEK